MISWHRSGAQLRVVSKWGVAGSPPNLRWFISIEVSNTGRLATEITQVGFHLPRKESRQQIVDFEDVLGMPIAFPRTLAPGATSVMYAADRLLAVLTEERLTGKRARPCADTASGRVYGRPRRNPRHSSQLLSGPVASADSGLVGQVERGAGPAHHLERAERRHADRRAGVGDHHPPT